MWGSVKTSKLLARHCRPVGQILLARHFWPDVVGQLAMLSWPDIACFLIIIFFLFFSISVVAGQLPHWPGLTLSVLSFSSIFVASASLARLILPLLSFSNSSASTSLQASSVI